MVTNNHPLIVLRLPAANLYSESLAEFTLEGVLDVPPASLFELLAPEQVKKASGTPWDMQIRRTRIFRFDRKPTAEDLSILCGFVDERTPLPFIDAFWYQGEIIDIAISGLFEVPRAERAHRAALLSVGLELFNIERNETKIKNLIAAIMTATIKKQWGGARRKPKDFTPATCERFAKRANELQPLWTCITRVFEKNDYDAGCVAMVKRHSEYQQLSTACGSEAPTSLLKRVFQRKNQGGEEYWPSTFALLHAKAEIGITREYAIGTLHNFYRTGNKALKQRNKPSGS